MNFGKYIPSLTSTPSFDVNKNGPYIPIANNVPIMKRKALEKLDKWREISEKFAYTN